MQFESGAFAELFCSATTDEAMSLDINANAANVSGINLVSSMDQRKLTINNEPFIFDGKNSYVEQLRGFVHSVLNNTAPEVTLEEALKSVAQLVAIKS
jgi:hypothetical protein